MPRMGPVTRAQLVRGLHALGFEGPYTGGKHQFMVRGQRRVRIANPHREDIGPALLHLVLREAGVSAAEWESV
jgi:predicted RNA binding protein YcfA (HicA-like mRNA interferase family)